jgi:hypothetical protein
MRGASGHTDIDSASKIANALILNVRFDPEQLVESA